MNENVILTDAEIAQKWATNYSPDLFYEIEQRLKESSQRVATFLLRAVVSKDASLGWNEPFTQWAVRLRDVYSLLLLRRNFNRQSPYPETGRIRVDATGKSLGLLSFEARAAEKVFNTLGAYEKTQACEAVLSFDDDELTGYLVELIDLPEVLRIYADHDDLNVAVRAAARLANLGMIEVLKIGDEHSLLNELCDRLSHGHFAGETVSTYMQEAFAKMIALCNPDDNRLMTLAVGLTEHDSTLAFFLSSGKPEIVDLARTKLFDLRSRLPETDTGAEMVRSIDKYLGEPVAPRL